MLESIQEELRITDVNRVAPTIVEIMYKPYENEDYFHHLSVIYSPELENKVEDIVKILASNKMQGMYEIDDIEDIDYITRISEEHSRKSAIGDHSKAIDWLNNIGATFDMDERTASIINHNYFAFGNMLKDKINHPEKRAEFTIFRCGKGMIYRCVICRGKHDRYQTINITGTLCPEVILPLLVCYINTEDGSDFWIDTNTDRGLGILYNHFIAGKEELLSSIYNDSDFSWYKRVLKYGEFESHQEDATELLHTFEGNMTTHIHRVQGFQQPFYVAHGINNENGKNTIKAVYYHHRRNVYNDKKSLLTFHYPKELWTSNYTHFLYSVFVQLVKGGIQGTIDYTPNEGQDVGKHI